MTQEVTAMFRTLFSTPVFFDADDGGGGGEAPDAGGDLDLEGIDLDDIAPEEPEPEVDTEWAEPPEVPEGVDQFDREYVEQLRRQAADYRTRARTLHEQFDGVDPEAARQALAWRDELQTEAGVIKMFYDAGHSLGLGNREIEALFKDPSETGPDDELDDEELDLPLTKREMLEFLQEQVLKPQQDAAEAAKEAEFVSQLKSRIDGVFTELEVADDDEKAAIAALADQLVPAGKENDPAAIEVAVREAHTKWAAAAEARVKAYIETKRKAAAKVPKTPDGGAPPAGGAPAEDPPKSVAEAIERRKARERAARGE